jgi:uncharacterized protein YycO
MPKVLLQIVTTRWDPIDFAIRFKCGGWCSHAEYVFPDGSTLGARMTGVKIRPASASRGYTRVQRYTFPYIEQACEWAITQVGKPYDFTAIAGIAFNRNWREEDSWFCSEYIEMSSEKTPGPLLNDDAGISLNWISPRDLLLSTAIQSAHF